MARQNRRGGRRPRKGGRSNHPRSKNRKNHPPRRSRKHHKRPAQRKREIQPTSFWQNLARSWQKLFEKKPTDQKSTPEYFLNPQSIDELPALLTQFPELIEKIPVKTIRVPGDLNALMHPKRVQHLVHDNYLFIQQESRLSDYISERVARQMEFCLPQWLKSGERSFLACGFLGSEFCYGFFRLAQKFGWDLEVWYAREKTSDLALLQVQEMIGAGIRVKFFESRQDLDSALKRRSLFSFFKKAQLLPFEGLDEYSVLAYASAYLEVSSYFGGEILPTPKYVFCSVETPAALAGLELGKRLAGHQEIELWGISSSQSSEFNAEAMVELCAKAQDLLRPFIPAADFPSIASTSFKIFESRGPKKASFKDADYERWIQQVTSSETLELDRKNSAPAFLGVSEFLRTKRIQKTAVLFWNTYGGLKTNAFNFSLRRTKLPAKIESWRNQLKGILVVGDRRSF